MSVARTRIVRMFDKAVVDELTGVVHRLADLPSTVGDDGARIDVIATLERLKAAAAAAQLGVIDEFAASQEATNKALGVQERAARRGVPEQVGMARKVAPATAARQVSLSRALRQDLPETLALLSRGEVSEWLATIVATETSHLAGEDRRLVDKQLAAELPGLSPRRAQALARKLTIEIDPAGAVARAGKARKDRRVGVRPAPDTMAVLSALLPCEQGVAAWAALRRHTDSVIAAGDERSRDQIMADTLVERLTGQATADEVSAEIGLVMSDAALLGGDDEAAELDGYGPIPAEFARDIARRAGRGDHPDSHRVHGDGREADADGGEQAAGASGDRPATGPRHDMDQPVSGDGDAAATTRDSAGSARPEMSPAARRVVPEPGLAGSPVRDLHRARIWLRRLLTDPITGIIIDVDPRRRRFDGVLARLLLYRDRTCRDPYCDAPIRHLDHIQSHAAGGPTTSMNGRGLCERGNYVREMPGWMIKLIDSDRHIVETTTPTGHRYRSRPPAAPGTGTRLRR